MIAQRLQCEGLTIIDTTCSVTKSQRVTELHVKPPCHAAPFPLGTERLPCGGTSTSQTLQTTALPWTGPVLGSAPDLLGWAHGGDIHPREPSFQPSLAHRGW